MELSVNPLFKTGIALTLAGAIALSPVIATNQQHHPFGAPVHLPRVTTSQVHLSAAVSPQDVAALTANLQAALASAGSTVSAVVDGAPDTLTGALSTAAGLSNSLWDQLIAAAGNSPTLTAVLVALKATSGGALLRLSDTMSAAGEAVTLTTGQIAELLTSTVTGTVGTAIHAVSAVVDDPLSASSYIGLLNTPFGIAGLALQSGITGVSQLGANGLQLANSLVHGVTGQVSNLLDTVNGLLDAGKTVTDVALVNGTLTAIQGIVSAPVNAALAGVNGLASAVTHAGVTTLHNLAGGANAVVGTWLGSGTTAGAIVKAASTIGTEPLSLASYTHAVSILVGAGASTVGSLVDTAGAFASLPFRVGADLTGTGAAVVNALVFGVAQAASGLLQAAGMSPIVAGLPNNLATVITGAVNVAALATTATLNTIATAIDIGHAITGFATSSRSTVVTLGTARADGPESASLEATSTEAGAPPAADHSAGTATTPTPSTPHLESATNSGQADLAVESPTSPEAAEKSAVEQSPSTATTDENSTGTSKSDSTAGNGVSTVKDSDVSDAPTVKKKPSTAGSDTAAPAATQSGTDGRHAAVTQRKAGAATATTATDAAPSESGGRHRRAENASHAVAADTDATSTADGSQAGGRHAAPAKHAPAA